LPTSPEVKRRLDKPLRRSNSYEKLEDDEDGGKGRRNKSRFWGRSQRASPRPTTSRGTPRTPREQAVVVIQKSFHTQQMLFDNFGEMILCRHGGGPPAHGRLVFPKIGSHASEKGASTKSSPFIVISDTTSVVLCSKYIEKKWRLPKPEVIISVTGGAQNFNLSAPLQRAFDVGLASAANASNAWILTAGTDSGVMKLTANCVSRAGMSLPLIAVAPYGAVNGRELFDDARDDRIVYANVAAPSKDGAPINAHHTHFVMVESGQQGVKAWGSEIDFRARLEHYYCHNKGVTLVLLVVQGGPGTLKTVLASAKQRHPVLIVSDSGGAAAAIAEYVQEDNVSDVLFQKDELLKTLESIRQLHQKSGELLLTFFSLNDDEEMSKLLLQAIVKMMQHNRPTGPARSASLSTVTSCEEGDLSPVTPQPSLRTSEDEEASARRGLTRALLLANNWDRLDVLSTLLQESEIGRRFSRPHVLTLQRALELNRFSIAQMLLGMEDADVSQLNLARLYLRSSLDHDQYHFLKSQHEMHARFVPLMRRVYRPCSPEDSYQLFKDTVGPMLASISPTLATLLEHSVVASYGDLFVWSLISDLRELTMFFWERCDHPLRAALLGSHVCWHVSNNISWGQRMMAERGVELQSWALGMLSEVPSAAHATAILSHVVSAWGQQTVLDQAMEMQRKEFLSHRYCQALMEQWWRGDGVCSVSVHSSTSALLVLFFALVPIFNPFLSYSAFHWIPAGFQPRVWKIVAGTNNRRKTSSTPKSKQQQTLFSQMYVEATALAAGMAVRERLRASRSSLGLQPKAKGDSSYPKPLSRSSGARGSGKVGVAVNAIVGSTAAPHGQYSNLASVADLFADQSKPRDESFSPREVEDASSMQPGFYSIPSVMYMGRMLSYGVFVMLFTLVLSSIINSEHMLYEMDYAMLSWLEIALFLWGTGHVLDNIYQGLDPDVPSNGLPAYKMLVLSDLIFMLAYALRFAAIVMVDGRRALLQAFQLLLSIFGIFVPVRIVLFRSIQSKGVGVLVIMLTAMVLDDLLIFLEIFLLFTLGFSLTFLGIFAASPDEHDFAAENEVAHRLLRSTSSGYSSSPPPPPMEQAAAMSLPIEDGQSGSHWQVFMSTMDTSAPFTLPFWAVYGEMNLDRLDVPFSSIIMWTYTLFSSIVLVNLLVAMFSDTYARIKANSELEFKYQKYVRVFQYLYVMHPVPPPFNMPFVLHGLADMIYAKLCGMADSRRDAGTRCTATHKDLDVHGFKFMKSYLSKRKSEEAQSALGITKAIRATVGHLEGQQMEDRDLAIANFKALDASVAEAKAAVAAAERERDPPHSDAPQKRVPQATPSTRASRRSTVDEMAEEIEQNVSSRLAAKFEVELNEKLKLQVEELHYAMENQSTMLGSRVSNSLHELGEALAERVSNQFAQLSAQMTAPAIGEASGTSHQSFQSGCSGAGYSGAGIRRTPRELMQISKKGPIARLFKQPKIFDRQKPMATPSFSQEEGDEDLLQQRTESSPSGCDSAASPVGHR